MTKESIPFSKRYGHVKVSDAIQISDINYELRTAIWNYIYIILLAENDTSYQERVYGFCKLLYAQFFNKPIDSIPYPYYGVIKDIIFDYKWYIVYDFLEFVCRYNMFLTGTTKDKFQENINNILAKYNSGYRFVDGLISPITNQQEINTVEEAINQSPYDGIKMHLHSALEKLSDKEGPDYRNSIKESISAVEVYVRKITGESTLGKAIDKLETKGVKIPQMLNVAIEKLYVFTNDSDGVRHALMDEPDTSKEEAYFMLIACSSLVNYLKAKEAKIKEKKDAE